MTVYHKSFFLLILLTAGLARPGMSRQRKLLPPNQIKISPLRLIDEMNPGLEISYERILARQFSTQIGVGYMKPLLGVCAFDNYRGWRYTVEQKYFVRRSLVDRSYWSLDAVYLKVNYDNNAMFTDSAETVPEYSDDYHINKRTLAFNIKRGLQIPFKQFIVDFSAGIGVKYKMTKRTGLQDPDAVESHGPDLNAFEMTNRPGNYFTISLPVNIRIGYHF